jgi:hypothetical protein
MINLGLMKSLDPWYIFFKEFKCKHKGKNVCSSSELVSVAAGSMMEPKSGMMVGETSFSKSKGKEEKK